MSSHKKITSSTWDIIWRNLVLIAVIVFVIALAWWLGSVVGYYSLQDLTKKPAPPAELEEGEKGGREIEPEEGYPFYIFVGNDPCAQVAQMQYQKAKNAGVNRFVLEIPFPWRGSEDLPMIFQRIQCVYSVVGNRQFWLFLDLNPPAEWFQQGRQSLRMEGKGEIKEYYVCYHSAVWKKTVEDGMTLLVEGLATSKFSNSIGGFILGFLEEKFWIAPGLDTSECAISAFNYWLQKRLAGSGELFKKISEGGINRQMLIDKISAYEQYKGGVFFPTKEYLLLEYYRQFSNESLADTAGFCAMVLRRCLNQVGMKSKIYIPYGLNLESYDAESGQFSLGNVLDSDIDGFVLPISRQNRSLGESGGPSGTVESMLLHGKEVVLWDDTVTGVKYNEEDGTVTRVKGVRSDSVYAVQRRNFGTAWVHNAGLMWADPFGDGLFVEDDQWAEFEKLIEAYQRRLSLVMKNGGKGSLQIRIPKGITVDNGKSVEEILPRLQLGRYNTEEISSDLQFSFMEEESLWEPMAVLIDERLVNILTEEGQRFYSKAVVDLREQLMKVGLPVEFYLLQDLLDQRIPRKLIYFIFSIYPPTTSEVDTLHSIFETDKSMVIWYLPCGWAKDGMTVDLINNLTQTNVELIEENIGGNSYFDLDGRWLKRQDSFGEGDKLYPLVAIADTEADVVARYSANNKPSVSLKTVEEKWVSVVYAEPKLDFLVIREILALLEVPVIVDEGLVGISDTILIGPQTVVLHTNGVGNRTLRFNRFVDVENLFEPIEKRREVEFLELSLGSAETIFLLLEPK